MNQENEAYELIKQWKDENIFSFSTSGELNIFHDSIMKKVFINAFQRTIEEHGKPTSSFSWFVTGSAGRFEQGYISDQDHGLVFNSTNQETVLFFYELGKEISFGLHEVGYPYCEGKVMSSNPTWCKSLEDWKKQITHWADDGSLESIRYLQIFFDARNLYGEADLIIQLKGHFFDLLNQNPVLIERFYENIRHYKKSVGVFGQVFVEQNGPFEGSLDIKQSAFIPYVNAIRLLSIKEEITESSTLARINKLSNFPSYDHDLRNYEVNFRNLLEMRLSFFKGLGDYTKSHYLPIGQLSKLEKKNLIKLLKDGEKLHHYVQDQINKG
jgi:CBS domain-containing protein